MSQPLPDNRTVDYYSVLNVPRDAAEEEIRRAYRQLASVSHPDKVQDPDMQPLASSNFVLVQEAYEVSTAIFRRG
jgi:DnaJ-class molecular chaperone